MYGGLLVVSKLVPSQLVFLPLVNSYFLIGQLSPFDIKMLNAVNKMYAIIKKQLLVRLRYGGNHECNS